jgi:hypothetical protein
MIGVERTRALHHLYMRMHLCSLRNSVRAQATSGGFGVRAYFPLDILGRLYALSIKVIFRL